MNYTKAVKHFNTNVKNKIRLIIFPYAGGSASVFKQWGNSLSTDIEICSIQLPGREDRYQEKPFTEIESYIKEFSGYFQGLSDLPFVFFGHSLGALFCYEVCRYLEKNDLPLPLHVFISGASPPRKFETNEIKEYNDEELKKELISLNGIPEEFKKNENLLKLFLPVIRSDIALLETYDYKDDYKFSMPISVFGGALDRSVPVADLQEWNRLSDDYCKIYTFTGDHFFIFSEQDKLLSEINREMKYLLLV